jgi:uncharacterized protein
MFLPFLDSTFLLLIPVLIFAVYAQVKVKSVYKKYDKIENFKHITGSEIAKDILETYKISNVDVEETSGKLTDHYDPIKKKLRLSSGVYNGSSISALGISAHEAGHAIQHAQGNTFLSLRNMVYPAANIGSKLAFPLFFIGLFFFKSKMLMDLGIFLYIGAVAFTLITLPVEFDASKKALVILGKGQYLTKTETEGARKVLQAAALTYVAAAAMAVMQLIRLLVLRDR